MQRELESELRVRLNISRISGKPDQKQGLRFSPESAPTNEREEKRGGETEKRKSDQENKKSKREVDEEPRMSTEIEGGDAVVSTPATVVIARSFASGSGTMGAAN